MRWLLPLFRMEVAQVTVERQRQRLLTLTNKAIQDLVNRQENTLKQVTQLERQKQEAQTEANKLRKTFAKHDLGNLALNKPGLIEKIVNKGTKKVMDELVSVSTHSPNDPDTTD